MSNVEPNHYKRLNPEPIVVIEQWQLGFCLGNVLKYISRAGHKPNVDVLDDLRKAQWYLNRMIQQLESQYDQVDE